MKYYLYLYANPQKAEQVFRKFAESLCHSKHAMMRPHYRSITLQDLTLKFKTPAALDDHQLDGLHLVGCTVHDEVRLNAKQVDYLNSRIRT